MNLGPSFADGQDDLTSGRSNFPPGNANLRQALLFAAGNRRAPPLHVDYPGGAPLHAFANDWVRLENTADDHIDHDAFITSPGIATFKEILVKTILNLAIQPVSASPHTPSRPSTLPVDVDTQDWEILRAHGYDSEHVRLWTTILTTTDSVQAARLLTARPASDASSPNFETAIPAFVYLYFLDRGQIAPEAFRMLVAHMPTWYQELAVASSSFLENPPAQDSRRRHILAQDVKDSDPDPQSAVLQVQVFSACAGLLRHARRVWPESLPTIADYITTYIRLSHPAELDLLAGHVPSAAIARLTAFYNRSLYLLSDPTAVEPYKGTVFREAAQAAILTHMAQHSPPLIIDREGYRGVLRVQLAQAKTPQEAEWARLKSPSWPPWKEDRTGMDAVVGLEYGVSRALHVLHRMQEAGYAMQPWECAALIYAGWDTDLSPTIQRRTIMPNRGYSDGCHVWAARVRSTRTVHEAWACFLSYEDTHMMPHEEVYLAMFEKLVGEQKRLTFDPLSLSMGTNSPVPYHPILPGDTREVFPPPASIHQAIYTKTPPLAPRQLLEQMLRRGSGPSGRIMALLINNARSLDEGVAFLRSGSGRFPGLVENLLYDMNQPHDLDRIPNSVFSAVINLLMRFPHTPLAPLDPGAPSRTGVHRFGPQRDLDLRQPLGRAIYLIDTERRQYLPVWNAVLKGLARRIAPVIWTAWERTRARMDSRLNPFLPSRVDNLDKIAAFNLTRQVLTVMRDSDLTLDVIGFWHLCICIENATHAAYHIIEHDMEYKAKAVNPDKPRLPGNAVHKAKAILESATFVREQFWILIGQSPSDRDADTLLLGLPRLLTVPNAPTLHAYVRVLGLLRDYEGLQELILWMRDNWSELGLRREMDRNHAVVLRRCVVAMRVFLEGRWEGGYRHASEVPEEGIKEGGEGDVRSDTNEDAESADDETVEVGAPQLLIDRMIDTVSEVEEWGGWASDEEADLYVKTMKAIEEEWAVQE